MKTIFILLLVSVIISCGSSVNLTCQKRISDAFVANSNRSVPAGGFTNTMPITVGQFTVYGMTNSDGEKSLFYYTVIEKQASGIVVEVMTLNQSSETVMQYKGSNLEKAIQGKDPDLIDFEWVKMRTDDGEIQTVDGAVLGLMKGMYRSGMGMWTAEFAQPTDGGPITVPAGTFEGTTKASSTIEMVGMTFESTGYYSASVPISGLVKSTDGDGNTMTLIDFGTTGGKSNL